MNKLKNTKGEIKNGYHPRGISFNLYTSVNPKEIY